MIRPNANCLIHFWLLLYLFNSIYSNARDLSNTLYLFIERDNKDMTGRLVTDSFASSKCLFGDSFEVMVVALVELDLLLSSDRTRDSIRRSGGSSSNWSFVKMEWLLMIWWQQEPP